MDTNELWKSILGDIELEISKANFATWFKNTTLANIEEGKATVVVPSSFVKEWLEDKYNKQIIKIMRFKAPEVRSVEFAVSTSIDQEKKKTEKDKDGTEEQMDLKELYVDGETNLNPRYGFENFVVGSFNDLAHAASLAVTKNLGKLYNPLFIYGGVGLGKTHLLQSIGNTVKKDHPSKKIYYMSAEQFFNELLDAIRNNSTTLFKDKYRSHDLLILDDIQFISNKMTMQEEIFHTFNTMYEADKQIVFSSDRPPKSIQNLEERLRSRFEGGMIADVSEPEYEARLAILQIKCSQKKEYAPTQEIVEYIAQAVQSNIRELEGSLNSIIMRSKLKKRALSLEEVKDIISKNLKPPKIINAQQVIESVVKFYNITEKDILEKTRRKEIVYPRQIAMYLLREDFGGSYPYIGQKFGGRDHTTAIHAYEKINNDIKKDDKLSEEVKQIRDMLYNK